MPALKQSWKLHHLRNAASDVQGIPRSKPLPLPKLCFARGAARLETGFELAAGLEPQTLTNVEHLLANEFKKLALPTSGAEAAMRH